MVTACDFPRGGPVAVYATGPDARVSGEQAPPYGVGQFIGTITPRQQSECRTKSFRLRWNRAGLYRFTLVQKTHPGYRVSRATMALRP